MALCQDSWAEWTKKEPKTFEFFRNRFMNQFAPIRKILTGFEGKRVGSGMHIAQAFPGSIGMAWASR